MAIPVINELINRGHNVVPFALTTARAVMKRERLDCKSILDYVDVSEVKDFGSKFLSRHHTEGKGISLEESIAYLGCSFRDLVHDVGEQEALKQYEKYGLNAFCATNFMHSVIEIEKPDVVIATTSPRMEKAVLNAAYQKNIPSLCMVDLFAILELNWLKRKDNGRYLTVYSELVAKRLINAGRSPLNIKITGNPAFDVLGQIKIKHNKQDWHKKNSLNGNIKIITWAEQPENDNPDLPRKIRNILTNICSKNNDWKLVVRLHPSSTDASKEIIDKNVIQSCADDSLQELIVASDVVITLTSTVAMEALLINKNVLILKISQYSHLVDYSEKDGALVIDDLMEIENGINQLLYDQPTIHKLESNRKKLPLPGNASNKICDLIESKEFSR